MTNTPDLEQTLSKVLADVAAKINVDAESLTADTDLFTAGLDSIALMELVAQWRAAGRAVDFSSLAREPRLSSWTRHFAGPESSVSDSEDAIPLLATETQSTLQSRGANLTTPFPLAPMQYAYWLGRDPKQPLGGVAAHLYVEFHRAGDGEGANSHIDPNRLALALAYLIERHSSLRMQVTSDGQQIHLAEGEGAKLTLNDWRNSTEAEARQGLDECRETFSTQMLDIEAGEVLAIALSLLNDGGSRLHLDIDFIAVDAASYRTLMRELALLYEDLDVVLPPLLVSYRDYRVANEKRWPKVKEEVGQWWRERLGSLPEGPQLPLKDRLDSATRTTRRHFHFAPELRDTLYATCRQYGLTPAAVLATILAETLAGWSREPRFLLNVPLFLRPMSGPDLSGLVGDFSSSVMLEVDMGPRDNFVERARRVQSRLHEDAGQSDYGGVQVLRDLGRMKGRQITAPVVFTSGLNLGELFDPVVRRVFGDPVWIISQGPQVLLDAQVTELDGGLLVNWDCREDAFLDGVLDAMFTFFHQSVQALSEAPETWLHCLSDTLPEGRVIAKPTASSLSVIEQPAVAPRTFIEKAVASVWSEVIGVAGDNIHQNMFAAGGDSLLAGTLVAQLREVFGVTAIDLQKLLAEPTIAGLGEAIEASGDAVQVAYIAEVYCEILELDDEALMAELETVAES